MINRIFIAIIIAIAILLFFVIWTSIAVNTSPCKSSTTCLSTQTCDFERRPGEGGGFCASLPGYKCRTNTNCSSRYAPWCTSDGHYCTNNVSKPRGAPGNPPVIGQIPCDRGLVLNTDVNLCQWPSIGAHCAIDAECGLGLCDQRSQTCQYGTSRCSTDTSMNAHQCSPQSECDAVSLSCVIPGVTPGGDGSPCTTTDDCAAGINCVLGPPGSGWTGVCRSGKLGFLAMVYASSSSLSSTSVNSGTLNISSNKCVTPLVNDGTGWCRYDIQNFMICSSIAECQYPYGDCQSNVCVSTSGEVDPIIAAGFRYTNIAFNFENAAISGSFYLARYPRNPIDPTNPSGGKMIEQYTDFLPLGQFEDAQFIAPHGPIISFSTFTTFCVAAINLLDGPSQGGDKPVIPYYTAIQDDRAPSIVASTMTVLPDVSKSKIFVTYFNKSHPLSFLPNNGVLLSFGSPEFLTQSSYIWNPAAIADSIFIPGLDPVPMISNPIVSSWVNIISVGVAPTEAVVVHTLFVDGNRYAIDVMWTRMSNPALIAGNTIWPTDPDVQSKRITTTDFIVLSWDALTTQVNSEQIIYTTVILFGIDTTTYATSLRYLCTFFRVDGSRLVITNSIPANSNYLPLNFGSISATLTTQNTFCRLSRSLQTTEPLMIVSIFSMSADGLLVSMFSQDARNPTFKLEGSSVRCAKSITLGGIIGLTYVTPVTGPSNYGGFIVQCKTAKVDQAFCIVQVNGTCQSTLPPTLSASLVYSMVYWRFLNSELTPYTLYPIGGASLPFFLATGIPLDFRGRPIIQL